ncbi:ABC transporter ATP-binding protein [Polyangium aurulentum]|uniref:ABC transporter ATP-binding protein n=1 Tax=Polyangium aurulentum TaxID=2567896 RepID=UPI0010AE9A64|nr:ABC transporter ATP-binding protein [Polyangium aurulentum]UQA58812.1 ABC transporter ATP-binding protein [Polyangium aurulentum]
MNALELVRVSKTFGDCVACDDVSLEVGEGEVVAVVGENGAGKSTAMSVACGLYKPTRGEVRVKGRALEPGSTRAAIAAGIGMVHQHFMLVPPLTIAENVALGAEPGRGPIFDRKKAEQAVAELSKRLGFGLEPRQLVADCSVATQQRVEILKVLYRGADVLILDEPTAVLAPAEADALLETVRALAAEGKSIIIISHKLREVLAVAARIAVMRRGKLVATVKASETSASKLAALMVGTGADHVDEHGAGAKERKIDRGERVAHLRGVRATGDRGLPALEGVDLELFAGEIVAVAGVDGNGQTELAEVLTGLRPVDGGTFELSPAASSRDAVAHIPEDRQRRGLCLSLSVGENLALGRHRAKGLVKSGPVELVDAAARARLADELITTLDVRPTDPSLPAAALSGGNQQKVIVARELLATPRLPGSPKLALVVAVQPTRGLDLGAIANVHARLREARDAGAAVLVVSLDLDEVRALGDRIVVMARGRVVAELPAGADEALIGQHMLADGDAAHG